MRIPLRCVVAVLALACPAARAQLVINECFTGTPDFLELRNCTQAPLDISGWSIATWYATAVGAAPTPDSGSPFVFPTGTIVPANGFLVVEENGVSGSPGTLPNSIAVGYNLFWVANRTLEAALTDPAGVGVDYMYRDVFTNGTTPNLPIGTSWSGNLSTGIGDELHRGFDLDTDNAADWVDIAGVTGTPDALNPGQAGLSCGGGPPPMMLTIGQSGPGVGDFSMALANLSPGASQGWTLISTDTAGPALQGPFFGLYPDVVTWDILLNQPSLPGNPLHFPVLGIVGFWPTSAIAAPPGALLFLNGVTWDFRVIVFDAGLNFVGQSNLVRFSFT